MDRRTSIRTVAAVVLSASRPSRARDAPTIRRIGVLDISAPFPEAELEAEYAPLRARGWIVGQNLIVERRYASGRTELFQAMAEELVRLKVDLIVTFGTDATLAAKRATTTIPIVIHSSGDPVRLGLVASLARPGGNVTGFSMALPETDARRVALLRELLPGLQRVGVLEDSANPYFRAVRDDFEQKCSSLGVKPIFVEFASPADIDNAVTRMAQQRVQALLMNRGGKYWDNRVAIIGAASRYAIPTSAALKEFLHAGALLTYGNKLEEQFERQAAFVDRILRGASPADLPIEQPTRFELGINLKTAQTLGIVVPRSLVIQAAEVVSQ